MADSATSRPARKEADVVIVGGGIAGCILASRLHALHPALDITLLEAGQNVDNHPLTSTALGCFAAHYSDLDWAYTSVPQKHLALSGGSAVNYGTWNRGSRGDYERWVEVTEDESWGYDALLPYFKKVEKWFEQSEHGKKGDGEQHGHEGPIHVTTVAASSPKRKYPLRDAIKSAWARLGVQENRDGNAGDPLGSAPLVESWREGKRQLASRAYDLTGVDVRTGVLVQRIIIEERDGGQVATGVELASGDIVKARKQVILSAGAYRSPQILMLSGIGPKAALEKFDIPVIVDSADVGQNFHDHLGVCLWWKVRHPERGLALGTPVWTDPAYMLGIPCDWLVTQHHSSPTLKSALLQDGEPGTHHLLNPQTCHTETFIAYAPAGARLASVDIPMDGSHISSIVLSLAPTSRGAITISSASVLDPPVIDPNYYATETDRVILRAAIRDAVRLMTETPEGRDIVAGERAPDGFQPLTSASTDEEVDERIRRVANTFYHPGGSVSLGKVVDGRLRVKNGEEGGVVKGLRVVDASLFPSPVAAHYQAVVYAVAEKAVGVIAEELEFGG
ncbi:hypothetical protein BDV96DRAFT_610142 [Lophiotrema nucula]|uniref:Glucose-methanol-choline oxidoreductase N-terminal domain-containing protein n=1 Tax=Lophiotrema nucula TaxID=690887 RepID=A0A6A5ZM12_9PLEO|nr:hypothetical protein BDV96DRAFT_610142 [Lophiotrema nucula]